jgi:hypothetical protein
MVKVVLHCGILSLSRSRVLRRSMSPSVQCPLCEHSISTSVIILQHCVLIDSENQKSSYYWRFVEFFSPFPADSSCTDQRGGWSEVCQGIIGMMSLIACRQTTWWGMMCSTATWAGQQRLGTVGTEVTGRVERNLKKKKRYSTGCLES